MLLLFALRMCKNRTDAACHVQLAIGILTNFVKPNQIGNLIN